MSLSKAKNKHLQALKLKKFREELGLFTVEGEKIAGELLSSKSIEIDEIFALDSWIAANEKALWVHQTKIVEVSEVELKQISNLTTPNKVLIVARKTPPPDILGTSPHNDDLIQKSFSFYLDGIQDPGNLGTIMRIADWFSIPYVFCSPTTVDAFNPKVIQASMGAFLRVQTLEMDFDSLKNRYPELPIFAAILRGDNIFETVSKNDFPRRGIVIIGNEGNGISEKLIETADFKITIPGGGGAESLNAAVSTGIIAAILTNGSV
jgi:RNA methyltransferase, TrmH family